MKDEAGQTAMLPGQMPEVENEAPLEDLEDVLCVSGPGGGTEVAVGSGDEEDEKESEEIAIIERFLPQPLALGVHLEARRTRTIEQSLRLCQRMLSVKPHSVIIIPINQLLKY